MTHAHCIFGEVPRGPRYGSGEPCRPHWQSRLPTVWQAQVVPPLAFRVQREYEVPARRVIGLDAAGAPCFCAYDYRLIEPRSDDDEEHYPALTYEQSIRAWRLRDGGWLVHRRLAPFGEDCDLITRLSLDERMPR